jgi:hypothetical protein
MVFRRITSFWYQITTNNNTRTAKQTELVALLPPALANGDWYRFYIESIWNIQKNWKNFCSTSMEHNHSIHEK